MSTTSSATPATATGADDGAPERPPVRSSVDAVLDFAWDAEDFTSSEAMATSGLTRSTTIEALDFLIDRGLIAELPNARASGAYTKGRPARRFTLRANAGLVLGMDVGRTHLSVALADLRGAVVHRRSIELGPGQDGAVERRAAVTLALEETVTAAGHGRGEIVAVCAGVPAPVNSSGTSPRDASGFWQRMNPGLVDLLETLVPIVRIENDASLAALAEGRVGAAVGSEDYVAMLAGDRIGSGVVLGGRLLRGTHGGAGEMIALDDVIGVGSANGLGLRIAEWARADLTAGPLAPGHPLGSADQGNHGRLGDVTARTIVDLARRGDPWAQGLVDRTAAVLARITSLLSSMYDPEVVVVCGAVADGLADVVSAATRLLPDAARVPPPRLVASTLGADVVTTGAVAGALEAARAGVLRLPARP